MRVAEERREQEDAGGSGRERVHALYQRILNNLGVL